MELTRRSLLVYGVLIGLWAVVVAWQIQEHVRVRQAARADLTNRSRDIANTVSACIRGMRFRGAVLQDRLEPVLKELVNVRTNPLIPASEVVSLVLLNATGEAVASAGKPIDLAQRELLQTGERWGREAVTFINPVDLGAGLAGEGATNPTVVLPPFQERTNALREASRSSPPQHPPPPPEGMGPPGGPPPGPTNPPPRFDRDGRPRDGDGGRPRRPFWLRGFDDEEYRALVQKRALHGLVLALSTASLEAAITRDLWLRSLIVALATLSVFGSGLAWRNLAKSSELQIRLVRASELNSHLREMNLAAAGLAHETRNPLNIIRGLAQMISKQPETAAEIRQKSRDIINEADKVAAQLNEFINYSRPREVRRVPVALGTVISEVVRALNYDLEEKKIRLQVKGEQLSVEADEQLLRQALFNLLLNASQVVEPRGEIQVVAEKRGGAEAALEVRDNGPGVPPERRAEIFKPYFTTQKQGTGLGLAVVQQIVLAHGWEIECLGNEPKGAVFRLTHLKIANSNPR